ncbi:hypothetical protein KI387_028493, partial [Taxus chinensis]
TMAQRYSWVFGTIRHHGPNSLDMPNTIFLSKKNGEEISDKFLGKFKKNPNIIKREIPAPFSPSSNLEIDVPVEEKREKKEKTYQGKE